MSKLWYIDVATLPDYDVVIAHLTKLVIPIIEHDTTKLIITAELTDEQVAKLLALPLEGSIHCDRTPPP